MGRKGILVAFLIILFRIVGFAQTGANSGTDFWVAFHENYSTHKIIIIITSEYTCTGTITSTYTSYSKNFTIIPGSAAIDTVPPDFNLVDGITDKGIHIVSDQPVSVNCFNYNGNPLSADTYLALPTPALGTEYYIMSMHGQTDGRISKLSVVATEDGTNLNIFNKATGQIEQATLNRGQAYQTEGNENEVTGSHVQSNHPVAVFGSNVLTTIPYNCSAGDMVVEEMPPVQSWGTVFYTVSTAGRQTDKDLFRILAKDNSTIVKINGTVVATINTGEYYETDLSGMNVIETSNPALVTLNAYSAACVGTNGRGDPFMMLIPPRNGFGTGCQWQAWITFFNYINIVASPGAVGKVYLDGSLLSTSLFSEIGTSGYQGARIDLNLGLHTVFACDSILVLAYGWQGWNSYGHPAGGAISPAAHAGQITLTPDSAHGMLNITNMCFTATLKNICDVPIRGVPVEFRVDGLGPILQSPITDSLGQAHFCYTRTGTTPGMDTIYAEVGNVRSTVSRGFWDICLQPGSGGSIASSQSNCIGFIPDPLVNTTDPSGFNGTIEYQWQMSRKDSASGFTDIPSADQAGFAPGFIDSTTWFRRLSRVSCDSIWPSSGISNVIVITISNQLMPAVSITVSPNPYCLSTQATATAAGVNGGQNPVYHWFLNGMPAGTDSVAYTWVPSPGDSIRCEFTSSLTCVTVNDVSSQKIVMQQDQSHPASITIPGPEFTFCKDSLVNLHATPTNGGPNPVYEWRLNGHAAGSNSPDFTFSPQDQDTVQCLLTSDLWCVSNNPVLSAPVVMKKSSIEAGFTVSPTETDLGDPVVTFTDQSVGATVCVIAWGDGTSTSCDSVHHTYTTAGTFSIRELVTNNDGCSDSSFKTVVIKPMSETKVFIPNAFTPNGDGLNDIFTVNRKDITDFTLLIYSRTGEQIFSSSDPASGWDGTFNGTLCPEGVYTYRVIFRDSSSGKTEDYHGHVTLLR